MSQPKLYPLTITLPFLGAPQTVCPVLLRAEEDLLLADCGFVGALPLLEEAIVAQGFAPNQVTALLLTHHDHDHMGAAAAWKRAYPQTKIYASAREAPYISGEEPSLRLLQARALQETLPPEARAFGEAFLALLEGVEPLAVDVPLEAGDQLEPWGWEVLRTPGHTPGHISLWHPPSKTLLAGDAMALEEGIPVIANPQFTLDMDTAQASMARLLALEPAAIFCCHGGWYYPPAQAEPIVLPTITKE